jgi:hypothetical protein
VALLADQTALWLSLGLAGALLVGITAVALLVVFFVVFEDDTEDIADVQRFITLTEEARAAWCRRASRSSTATGRRLRRPPSSASRGRRPRRVALSGRPKAGAPEYLGELLERLASVTRRPSGERARDQGSDSGSPQTRRGYAQRITVERPTHWSCG